MQFRKILLSSLAALAFLAGCDKDPVTPPPTSTASTIKVSVSEAGAPPYDLNEARVLNSNYQTGAPNLTISGKLNNGKVLLLNFVRNGTTSASTNALEGSLDGNSGTSSTGTTTYNAQTRTASGNFRSTFPVIGEVSGTFSNIAVQ